MNRGASERILLASTGAALLKLTADGTVMLLVVELIWCMHLHILLQGFVWCSDDFGFSYLDVFPFVKPSLEWLNTAWLLLFAELFLPQRQTDFVNMQVNTHCKAMVYFQLNARVVRRRNHLARLTISHMFCSFISHMNTQHTGFVT